MNRKRRVYLVLAYAKNVTEDLAPGRLRALKDISASLDAEG